MSKPYGKRAVRAMVERAITADRGALR